MGLACNWREMELLFVNTEFLTLACNWREIELLFVNTEFCKTLEAEQPQYAACRSLLRAGPTSSLRMNIRAVAQYVDEAGNDRTASNDVDQYLRALEELDSLLLNASRNERGASVKSMKSNIGITVTALNSLLQTVPTDILKKGKAIADAYNSADEDFAPQNLDPNLKQLESIM